MILRYKFGVCLFENHPTLASGWVITYMRFRLMDRIMWQLMPSDVPKDHLKKALPLSINILSVHRSLSKKLVLKKVGQTTVTPMLWDTSSILRVSDNPITPALVTLYGPIVAKDKNPAADAVFTIWP